jgi:fibro-slime domain-containing protein
MTSLHRSLGLAFLVSAIAGVNACGAAPVSKDDDGSDGLVVGTGGSSTNPSPGSDSGNGTGDDQSGPDLVGGGTGGSGSGEEDKCGAELPVLFRDFKGYPGHPDFEIADKKVYDQNGEVYKGWNDAGCGMVLDTLSPDRKPILFTGTPDQNDGLNVKFGLGRQQREVVGPGCWQPNNNYDINQDCMVAACKRWIFDSIPTSEITSESSFSDWYTTKEGVNIEIPGVLPLVDGTFDSKEFFPIDGQGFGNEGRDHNYHFTTEAHVKFTYEPGQKFTFRGDDDLWIFVNNKLALDLGGLHQPLAGTIDFDKLGLTPGQQYDMDIFHAERQTDASNFRVQTNITCFVPVEIIK